MDRSHIRRVAIIEGQDAYSTRGPDIGLEPDERTPDRDVDFRSDLPDEILDLYGAGLSPIEIATSLLVGVERCRVGPTG